MREDLNKLLCERERRGSKDKYGGYRHDKQFAKGDPELLPLRESMRKRHHTREFNENLNPLYGFIRKSVGKPWNKVYSEICKVFDKRSVINQHILQHLFQYVETTNAVWRNNQVMIFIGENFYRSMDEKRYLTLEDAYCEYYVHPLNGLLLKNHVYREGRKKRKLKQQQEWAQFQHNHVRQLSGMSWAVKDMESGIWYRYTAKMIPAKVQKIIVDEETGDFKVRMITPDYVPVPLINLTKSFGKYDTRTVHLPGYNSSRMYMAEKKQMRTRDLKRFELK